MKTLKTQEHMNSFSISKLSTLVQGNGHEIIETFVYKNHVRYLILFCKRFRHVFMMEIRNIPIAYDTDKILSEFHTSYGLYQIERPNIKNINTYNNSLTSSSTDQSQVRYLQKQRLDTLFKHDVFSIVLISESKLWHDKYCFQIESFKYSESYLIWNISLDDYYLQQSGVSVSIHERYSKFSDFIGKNVRTQFEYLSSILKNEQVLTNMLDTFFEKQDKFEKQFHLASTMFNRSCRSSVPNLEVRYKIISVLYQLFRRQSEFLLHNENIFFNILFHIQGIKELLNF